MCPACIATAAIIAAKATSTGGLTALVVKKFRLKTGPKKIERTTQIKAEHNEQARREQYESSNSSVAG